MKVLLASLVIAFMAFGSYTAFAGKACCAAKKAAKTECAGCGETKGSEECKETCAAEECAACGEAKGSEACKEACAKE